MRSLIVATDFSNEAENAAEYACAAAKFLQARVVLFNSFAIPVHVSHARLSASIFNELLQKNKSMLQERALQLSEMYGVEVVAESGFVQLKEELSVLFIKHNARMVIMGTKADSLGQELFGSTNTANLLKMDFPVLAIPQGATYRPVKKILFACDVLRGLNLRILEEIKDFASLVGAEVEVFRVRKQMQEISSSGENFELSTIDTSLSGVTHSFKDAVSDTVVNAIKEEISAIGADLLIMVPQRYGFWQSMLHRSKTRIMASESEIPLLSIPV